MTTMLEDEEIRKAKAKYQNIVASHTEWDDYCLSDELDDEYSLSDMVGEVYDVDFAELREVNQKKYRVITSDRRKRSNPKRKKIKEIYNG